MAAKRKSVREITETILEWEERHRVHRIRYGKLPVWPLLRLQIVVALSRGVGLERKENQEGSGKKKGRRRGKLPSIEQYPEIKPGKVLFWAQASKFVDHEGSPFHRFFDPLLEFSGESRDEHTCWIWEDGCEVASEDDELISINSWLGPLIEHANLTSPEKQLNAPGQKFLEDWNSVPELPSIEIPAFEKVCHQLVIWTSFFERCFALHRPSAVFLTCFYAELTMALTLAGRRSGIPCVELQHGQQGEWHTMYTHWTRAPRRGFDLIPDQFWMWGEPAAERVRSWMRGRKSRVFVGGNPWLTWRVERSEPQEDLQERTTKEKDRKSLVILISLQYSELPEFVWETIAARPNDRWLLRLHPRFRADQEAFIEECRERLPAENWEVEKASREDFYDVVNQADLHVTGWSTTAYEALAFGVPTILIHPNGLDAMRDSVESGVFGYAADRETFSAFLDSPPEAKEKIPTILAERNRIVECWKMFS